MPDAPGGLGPERTETKICKFINGIIDKIDSMTGDQGRKMNPNIHLLHNIVFKGFKVMRKNGGADYAVVRASPAGSTS